MTTATAKRSSLWLILTLAALAAALLIFAPGFHALHGQTCLGNCQLCSGPPLYSCANTSLTFFALPSVPPQMGPNTAASPLTNTGNLTGADTTQTDPNFGNPVTRITDTTAALPAHPYENFIVTNSGSGEENVFSTDSSLILVADDASGLTFPMTFGPVAGSSHRLYASSVPATNGFVLPGNMVGWSRVNPTLAYTVAGSNSATLQSYNFSGYCPSCAAPSPVTVYDFTSSANGLGSGFRVSWSTAGGLSQNDTDFAMGFAGGYDWQASTTYTSGYITGVITDSIINPSVNNTTPTPSLYQATTLGTSSGTEPVWKTSCPNAGNTCSDGSVVWTNIGTGGQGLQGAQYVAVDRPGSGVRTLNTTTACVAGDWGPTGCIPSPPCPASYLHNAKLAKQGGSTGFVYYTTGGLNCSPANGVWVWVYGAASLTGSQIQFATASYTGGHDTCGLLDCMNNPSDGLPNYMTAVTPTQMPSNGSNGITYALPAGGVQSGLDFHFGWNVLNDAWPFGAVSFVPSGAAPSKAWTDEVMACPSTYVPQNCFRFAQTENTGLNPVFQCAQSIPGFSQDGKWALFDSDWQGMFGSTAGASSCTLTSNCRCEVMAVKLR